jgi:DNA polymerase-3 subunit delta'
VEFTEDGKDKKTPVAFPIDVVREFVIDKVSNRPTLSRQRVFILSEGEKLSKESQNALLKVLEEPPEYCTIILLCTRLEKLLPTTKSRCRTVRFGPVAEDRIVEKLRQMGLSEALVTAGSGESGAGLPVGTA